MSRRTTPGRAAIRAAVFVTAMAMLVSACAVNGLSFVEDTRVKILQPNDGKEVTLPFEVTWDARDVEGYFVLFFDRSPMRSGQTLQSLVPEDDPCRAEATCPDAQWLADRNIYVTDGTGLRIESLPDLRETKRAKDRHDVTIVLLDPSGKRSRESSWSREFIVERED